MDDTLRTLFSDAFGADLDALDDGQELVEIDGWDSLAHMRFVVGLEEGFGFRLTGDEIADLRTVGDVRRVVAEKARAAG